MIIPGLVSATFKTESPDFVLAALQKADLHAVEWSENWHIPAGDTALARDLRERTLAQGAEIAGYGSYYRLGQNSERFFAHAAERCGTGCPAHSHLGRRYRIGRAGGRHTQKVGGRGKDRQ